MRSVRALQPTVAMPRSIGCRLAWLGVVRVRVRVRVRARLQARLAGREARRHHLGRVRVRVRARVRVRVRGGVGVRVRVGVVARFRVRVRTASPSSSEPTWMGSPLRVAPAPRRAAKTSPRKG